jgi:Zn finger protein HypA/HybF involved in hydrogenase expression
MPLSEIMVEYSTYQSSKLKIRLFNENIKEKRCECCNLTEWLSNPIPLELHHVNGVKTDHRLENLQIVCPNCHAQTDNYRGRNINLSAQEEISEVESIKFGEILTGNADDNPEPSLGSRKV